MTAAAQAAKTTACMLALKAWASASLFETVGCLTPPCSLIIVLMLL